LGRGGEERSAFCGTNDERPGEKKVNSCGTAFRDSRRSGQEVGQPTERWKFGDVGLGEGKGEVKDSLAKSKKGKLGCFFLFLGEGGPAY